MIHTLYMCKINLNTVASKKVILKKINIKTFKVITTLNIDHFKI